MGKVIKAAALGPNCCGSKRNCIQKMQKFMSRGTNLKNSLGTLIFYELLLNKLEVVAKLEIVWGTSIVLVQIFMDPNHLLKQKL